MVTQQKKTGFSKSVKVHSRIFLIKRFQTDQITCLFVNIVFQFQYDSNNIRLQELVKQQLFASHELLKFNVQKRCMVDPFTPICNGFHWHCELQQFQFGGSIFSDQPIANASLNSSGTKGW